MTKLIIEPHTKFGRLEFIKEVQAKKPRKALFRCECWKDKVLNFYDVTGLKVKSCWCLYNKHWFFSKWSTMYKVAKAYTAMKQRCYNDKNKHYKDYWWRWIIVCDYWIENINNFIEDMWSTWEEWLSLERVDNDKWYSKDNCKWVTSLEQSKNKRTTLRVEWKCLKHFCKDNWLNYWTAKYNFHKKKTIS